MRYERRGTVRGSPWEKFLQSTMGIPSRRHSPFRACPAVVSILPVSRTAASAGREPHVRSGNMPIRRDRAVVFRLRPGGMSPAGEHIQTREAFTAGVSKSVSVYVIRQRLSGSSRERTGRRNRKNSSVPADFIRGNLTAGRRKVGYNCKCPLPGTLFPAACAASAV